MRKWIVYSWLLIACFQAWAQQDLRPFMPREEDHSSTWWVEGYPAVVEKADWLRAIESGHYRYVLDTKKLEITELGSLGKAGPADLDLEIRVDGVSYRASGTDPVTRFVGPRLLEAGKFVQRVDVTGLQFQSANGQQLNAEAILENVAWPDRLGFALRARPGLESIRGGQDAFGRIGGGFGLTGKNRLRFVPESAPIESKFTLEFSVLVPDDFSPGKHSPWVVCTNRHEQSPGHIGLHLNRDGKMRASMNFGGGRNGSHTVELRSRLKTGVWNHLALSYDGAKFRTYHNGDLQGEKVIGEERAVVPGGLAFGDREDQAGGVYALRGIVDEIRIHDRALSDQQLRHLGRGGDHKKIKLKPTRHWAFQPDGPAHARIPREKWGTTEIDLRVRASGQPSGPTGIYRQPASGGEAREWRKAAVVMDPKTFRALPTSPLISIRAEEVATGKARPVTHDGAASRYVINLDGINPIAPKGHSNPTHDAIERVRLFFKNPTDQEQPTRLLFAKTDFRQRIGTPITGVTVMLRDKDGFPSGIPVQLSKNWHRHPEAGEGQGQWLHAGSLIHLPPKSELELELVLAYGHWGGLPAASHAQLSLVGWGGNQRWDESALGSWGESFCYDPAQTQADCTITDVRPLMVTSMNDRGSKWGWTNNVGGGDFFRLFLPDGTRSAHASMQTEYRSHGPCRTEVAYQGEIGSTGIRHREVVSLRQRDDFVSTTYLIRMDVTRPVDFSRFVIFQIGSDRYNPTREERFAVGAGPALIKEWNTQPGGNQYRGEPTQVQGELPWASLHGAVLGTKKGATANRGLVIRKWEAVLGGKEASPWFAERGMEIGNHNRTSSLDLVPPPGVTALQSGDYVEAVIEYLILPKVAGDYYGPNETFRTALSESADTWKLVQQEAVRGDLKVAVTKGRLLHSDSELRLHTVGDRAEVTLRGGTGTVSVVFEGLSSHRDHVLLVDGKEWDASVHGKDFWQTDYDRYSRTWSRTYQLPATDGPRSLQFHKRGSD